MRTQADPAGDTYTRRQVLKRTGQAVAVAGAAAGAAWYLHDPLGDAGLTPPEPITLDDYFGGVGFSASAPRISVAYGKPEQIDYLQHVRDMVKDIVNGLRKKNGVVK